jgi:hypothetical protein
MWGRQRSGPLRDKGDLFVFWHLAWQSKHKSPLSQIDKDSNPLYAKSNKFVIIPINYSRKELSGSEVRKVYMKRVPVARAAHRE